MAKFGGAFLKLFQTFLYALCFCCAGIIIGIYSYFLAVQADRDASIPTVQKAVEGMAGAAVVYTIFAVILTCCLGGRAFFAFLAILLDILFCAAFVAIAVLLRSGTGSCTGFVRTPLGNGQAGDKAGYGGPGGNNVTYSSSLGRACKFNKACFAVAIIGAFLFLISALVQLWLGRHHQREKRYGPSPANNYTSGSGTRWFGRKRGPKTTHNAYANEAELGAVGGTAGGLAAPPPDYRPSHDTAYTGTTVASPTNGTFAGNKYEAAPAVPSTKHHTGIPPTTHHTGIPPATHHTGYHTAPTGTTVNPYGYDNTHTTGTNF